MGSGLSAVDKINPNFSLRRYQPDQVQRVYLNSVQNTPKAMANVVFFPDGILPVTASNDVIKPYMAII